MKLPLLLAVLALPAQAQKARLAPPEKAFEVCGDQGEGTACSFKSKRGPEVGTCYEVKERMACVPDDMPQPAKGAGYPRELWEPVPVPVKAEAPKVEPPKEEPKPEPKPEPAPVASSAPAPAAVSTQPAPAPIVEAPAPAPIEPPPVPRESFPYAAAAGALALGGGLLALLKYAARPAATGTVPLKPATAPRKPTTPEAATVSTTSSLAPDEGGIGEPRLGPNGGRLVGAGYELRGELGSGGMGVVYEGWDVRLDRRLALKKMRPEITSNDRGRERFLGEAKLVARLQHRNIVGIHDVVAEGQDLYLVFEHVDGETLDDVVGRDKRVSPAKLVPILRGVAEAVDYAHGMKVIHRDLKPANIMIDKAGTPKVMDFGIAHEAKLTISRMTVAEAYGTLAYMPPEQELGQAVGASDIYALAALTYEALTGLLPFPGPNFHLQKEAMSFTRPSSLFPALPAKLDPVFERALQTDPRKRHQTAAEFAREIGAALGV